MGLCRLCTVEKDKLTNAVSKIDLALKIKECVSVEITKDDGLPEEVCLDCIKKVEDWSEFRIMCIQSNELLKNKFLKNEQIKIDNGDTRSNIDHGTNNAQASSRFIKKESIKGESADSEIYSEQEDDEDDKDFFEELILTCDESNNESSLASNTYECGICPKQFDSCMEYLDHQEEHNGDFVFKCSRCTEVFSTRSELVEHDRNHKVPCRYCGIVISKTSMRIHVIKHTNKHICPHCSNHFHSKMHLNQHIAAIHTGIKDHMCETCGKKFSTLTEVRVHLKSHSDVRKYKCKKCDYAGKTASALYVHMSTHGTGVCICEICSKTFKSNRNLNDHLRRVHSEEKKHTCSHCGKKFVDKYMLTVHSRSHTGVRPYQCKICNRAFIRSDSLKDHLATHGERVKYNCHKCGKEFTSKRSVTRHLCNTKS